MALATSMRDERLALAKEEVDAKVALIEEGNDAEVESAAEAAALIVEIRRALISVVSALMQGLSDLLRSTHAQEVADLRASLGGQTKDEKAYTAFLDEQNAERYADMTDEEKREFDLHQAAIDSRIDADEEAAEELRELKRKQARENRLFALFDIAIKTAMAVIAFLAQGNIPASIAAGVVGVIQAGVVGFTPIPTFAKGGWVGGESGVDQNTIRASAGEFIVSSDRAQQNAELLEAINEGRSITANIEPAMAPVILDGQIVGQVMIEFIESEANEGRLAINPQAIRADT